MPCKANSCSRPAREDGYCLTHSPARQRETRAANKERFKGYSLKRDYDLSIGEYKMLLKKQNGKCAICGALEGSEKSNNNGSKALSVDHDHITGEIRGLLCSMCNKGIGSLEDDPKLLLKAYEYLIEHKKLREVMAQVASDCIAELQDLENSREL